MFRSVVLGVAGRSLVRGAVTQSSLFQPLVRRFVAGNQMEDLLRVGKDLAALRLTITADYLGEQVHDLDQARAAAEEYSVLVDALADWGLEPNVSLKLSQFGLDIDPIVCRELVQGVVARAEARGGFVRIDMESSDYTQRTLDLLGKVYPAHHSVGVVIQSMLRRSESDLEWLLSLGARVRLVKGAYRESSQVAFPSRGEVDRSYARLLDRLMAEGHYPAVATHDPDLIQRALDLAVHHGRSPDGFEFQMLLGVRRDLQLDLRRRGFRVRVYTPYGTAWYPYLTRRMAERPENLLFLVRSVLKEARGQG